MNQIKEKVAVMSYKVVKERKIKNGVIGKLWRRLSQPFRESLCVKRFFVFHNEV